MKDRHQSFLIDVSRLVGRLMNGRLPTGVDRVALAYVKQYGHRAHAFVRDGRFHVVLPEKLSQTLFHLLLQPPPDFKSQAWRLIALGAAQRIRSRDSSGSFFFNVGHSGLDYHRYPELLRHMKVRPIFFVHDLIPITHPEYCRPGELAKHQLRMRTVLELAHGIVTNSQDTLAELASFASSQNLALPQSAPAFLGAPDLRAGSEGRPLDHPYFIVLGTIEPRKNHLLLLHVWQRLIEQWGEQAPRLVIIGQRGWECENVVDLLERCESLKGFILELSSCRDSELATWLRHAQALLFPSFVEGFGLPLVEALACGTPVIASDLAVFREIAADIPEYLDPLDGLGWRDLISAYCDRIGQKRSMQMKRLSGFVTPTWDEHFKQVDALLAQVGG